MFDNVTRRIGIDAINLRGGGGITHLIELLQAIEPSELEINQIIVWSGNNTLSMIEDRPWLLKIALPKIIDRFLLFRMFWQFFFLSSEVRKRGCSALFVPGGSYVGSFTPTITMSRNLLPFMNQEVERYGYSLFRIKLFLLKITQIFSYRNVDGVIFLTKFAHQVIGKNVKFLEKKSCIIPHGINPRFFSSPKEQRPIDFFTEKEPFRIIYVSTIDRYKHQWNVVEAVASLRSLGMPLSLILIGSAYPPALKRLETAINKFDPQKKWVHYSGAVNFSLLHEYYQNSDLAVFASSCENMPNTLLEMMASGLPIASSNIAPMPEILSDAGVYFNPESPNEIYDSLFKLISDPKLRTALSQSSHFLSRQYSWRHCSRKTFEYILDLI